MANTNLKKTSGKIKLVLKYDGTEFHGWQRQPGQRTVQGVLEDALGRILGRSPYVYGAGRTDSGVHALAQVAHFRTDEGPPLDEFRDALRHILPEDLGVVSMVRVKENFHARHHATGKIYRYVIHNNPFPDPFRSRFEALVRAPLHLESMKKAAAFLIGRHDFAAFRSAKATSKTTERNLDRITLIKKGKRIEVEFRAPGFLYHMVRNIIGEIIGEIPLGRKSPWAKIYTPWGPTQQPFFCEGVVGSEPSFPKPSRPVAAHCLAFPLRVS